MMQAKKKARVPARHRQKRRTAGDTTIQNMTTTPPHLSTSHHTSSPPHDLLDRPVIVSALDGLGETRWQWPT